MPATSKAQPDDTQPDSQSDTTRSQEQSPPPTGASHAYADRAQRWFARVLRKLRYLLRPRPTQAESHADDYDAPERLPVEADTAQSDAEHSKALTLPSDRMVGWVRSGFDTTVKRRRAGRLLTAFVIFLVAAPVVAWLQHQSNYVTSTNAIIRGHVTEIGTRLSGIVKTVEVDAGDRVVAGQILARLEDRHLLAKADEARALLAGLQRQLEVERLEIEFERLQLNQQSVEDSAILAAAEAETAAARFRAQNARESAEVRRELFNDGGAISGEAVRESETERRTTEAMMRASEAERIAAESAQAKTRLLREGLDIRERKIGILEADIAQAEASLSKAEADLEGASIVAPESGAIVRRIVQAGGSVDVGQPIISMWLGNDVWVEAWIDEEDIGDVRTGNKAIVTLQSFPDREFIGTVDRLGLTTDFEMPDEDIPQPRFSRMRGTPVVGIRIRLDNPPRELLPGLSAVVSIQRIEG